MIPVPYNSNRKVDPMMREGYEPCLICGRPTNYKRAAVVHVHGGGAVIVTEEEAASMNPAADLGAQPIGPDCLRRHPELRPYTHRDGCAIEEE